MVHPTKSWYFYHIESEQSCIQETKPVKFPQKDNTRHNVCTTAGVLAIKEFLAAHFMHSRID